MKEIDNILDKYFEGETSLAEEKLLRKYFQSDKVAGKHLPYAPIFCYMAQENEKLQQPGRHKPHKTKRFALLTSAAALLAVLLFTLPQADTSNISYVYVDGKKQKDRNEINVQALHSLMAIEEYDEDDDNILESQIDFLDSFIDME